MVSNLGQEGRDRSGLRLESCLREVNFERHCPANPKFAILFVPEKKCPSKNKILVVLVGIVDLRIRISLPNLVPIVDMVKEVRKCDFSGEGRPFTGCCLARRNAICERLSSGGSESSTGVETKELAGDLRN
jgi:hypothetical protein